MHAQRGATYLLLATCPTAARLVSAGGDPTLDMEGLLLPRQSSSFNLQAFTGALGGFSAPAISQSPDPERPFEVDGDTFTDYQSAVNRACDNQKNECARAANANRDAVEFAVSDCDRQNNECKDAGNGAAFTRFPTSSDAEFDFFCDE
ncbi:hypothetical protein DL764_005531 [Monosporascus ibericus]|uniref:Uncharacterized protein n=1 Tax=Monosporascus ibericus TaxID=155417 RepID=A0A4Q4T8L9_9PEZI|nr:hypothetical protein DL764_005531 [Monosporascus ibericus]